MVLAQLREGMYSVQLHAIRLVFIACLGKFGKGMCVLFVGRSVWEGAR